MRFEPKEKRAQVCSSNQILARFGWQATIGSFRLPDVSDEVDFDSLSRMRSRGARLVLQSPRGLEIGYSLGTSQSGQASSGNVVRSMLPEDEFLSGHLDRLSKLAHQRCVGWLEDQNHGAILLAVEPLMDGHTLYFHFLSGVDDLVQQQIDSLVKLYEAEVAASDFVQRVIKGCGPGCGTAEAAGRGCSSCSNCQGCTTKATKKAKPTGV